MYSSSQSLDPAPPIRCDKFGESAPPFVLADARLRILQCNRQGAAEVRRWDPIGCNGTLLLPRQLSDACRQALETGKTQEVVFAILNAKILLLPDFTLLRHARLCVMLGAGTRRKSCRPEPQLTPSEFIVALLVALRLRDKEVAAVRGTAVPTIKKQVRHVYDKLGIHSRSQLTAMLTCGLSLKDAPTTG